MVWVILIVGYLIMACCLAALIAPKSLRKIIDFFSIGSRLYLAGFIRIVLGVMLLILAGHVELWGYIVACGLILAASGLALFFFALRRTKELLSRLRQQPDSILRLYIIIALVIWARLIYALLPLIRA